MIKLVTIDLDGTLFDNKKNISKVNKDAIAKARAMGVYIVIATGRPLSGVMPTLKELGLTTDKDYVIIYNGAKIFNVGTGEMIFSSSITGMEVKALYQEAMRIGTYFHAFRINEELICNKKNPYTDVEAAINHVKDEVFDFNDVKDEDLFLKAMMVDSKENVVRAMNMVNPYFKEKYSMVRSSDIFLEFLNKSTDKGNSLLKLAEYLKIDQKETMALGDAGNDLPMILAAGVGVAMENAYPEVKAQADFITKTNEDNGVAFAFQKFIFQK